MKSLGKKLNELFVKHEVKTVKRLIREKIIIGSGFMKLSMEDKLRIMRSLTMALNERIGATIRMVEGKPDPNRTDIIGLAIQHMPKHYNGRDRKTVEQYFNMSLADLCKETKIDIGRFRPRKPVENDEQWVKAMRQSRTNALKDTPE